MIIDPQTLGIPLGTSRSHKKSFDADEDIGSEGCSRLTKMVGKGNHFIDENCDKIAI